MALHGVRPLYFAVDRSLWDRHKNDDSAFKIANCFANIGNIKLCACSCISFRIFHFVFQPRLENGSQDSLPNPLIVWCHYFVILLGCSNQESIEPIAHSHAINGSNNKRSHSNKPIIWLRAILRLSTNGWCCAFRENYRNELVDEATTKNKKKEKRTGVKTWNNYSKMVCSVVWLALPMPVSKSAMAVAENQCTIA